MAETNSAKFPANTTAEPELFTRTVANVLRVEHLRAPLSTRLRWQDAQGTEDDLTVAGACLPLQPGAVISLVRHQQWGLVGLIEHQRRRWHIIRLPDEPPATVKPWQQTLALSLALVSALAGLGLQSYLALIPVLAALVWWWRMWNARAARAAHSNQNRVLFIEAFRSYLREQGSSALSKRRPAS